MSTGTIKLSCAMAFAPDGRLFVTERNTGVIRTLTHGVLSAPWATVSVVSLKDPEAGLLGIAIDPDFLRNGYVYVFFTRTGPNGWNNVVGRFKEVNGKGTNLTLLTPPMPATGRHPGGPIEFGPDGKLYICTGEAGVRPVAQSLGDMLGKILRINPDGTVPRDNPLVGKQGLEPRIWSWGHRHPFGLAFGPIHGRPFVTENAAGGGDEINLIAKGGNYGWPIHDGPERAPDPATVDPIWFFRPDPSLTGAAFLTGTNYPAAYRNTMFVTDFNTSTLRYLTMNASGTRVSKSTSFHVHKNGTLLDAAEGPDGNLWVLHSATRMRGCDSVSRYVHTGTSLPALHLSAVSNRAVGGSITLGVTGVRGQVSRCWLSLKKHASPVKLPFGDLFVPVDLLLPPVPVQADGRAYLGLSIPDLPGLRGQKVHAQGVTATGSTLRLTPPAELVLR